MPTVPTDVTSQLPAHRRCSPTLVPSCWPLRKRGTPTGPVTLQTSRSQAGLFPFTGSARFSADSHGQSSIRIPQVYLCEHLLASVSVGSLRLHLWRSLALCSQAPSCWACEPRGLMVLRDRRHPGTAQESSAALPWRSWDHHGAVIYIPSPTGPG